MQPMDPLPEKFFYQGREGDTPKRSPWSRAGQARDSTGLWTADDVALPLQTVEEVVVMQPPTYEGEPDLQGKGSNNKPKRRSAWSRAEQVEHDDEPGATAEDEQSSDEHEDVDIEWDDEELTVHTQDGRAPPDARIRTRRKRQVTSKNAALKATMGRFRERKGGWMPKVVEIVQEMRESEENRRQWAALEGFIS